MPVPWLLQRLHGSIPTLAQHGVSLLLPDTHDEPQSALGGRSPVNPAISRRGLGQYAAITDRLSSNQRFAIQVCSAVLSGLSMGACMLCIFWFVRMQKGFRHRLILLLVIGDFVRSTWYFLFAMVSFGTGKRVKTESSFCQTTGFFVEYGHSTCDYVALAISIHAALIIFKPLNATFNDEGLYRFRHSIYVGALLIPCMFAALAFINTHGGYTASLPICALPVRPYWYRLALMWIPKWICWFVIIALAVRIYFYVGGEFKIFNTDSTSGSVAQRLNTEIRSGSSTLSPPGDGTISRRSTMLGKKKSMSEPKLLEPSKDLNQRTRHDSIHPSTLLDDTAVEPSSVTERNFSEVTACNSVRASLPAPWTTLRRSSSVPLIPTMQLSESPRGHGSTRRSVENFEPKPGLPARSHLVGHVRRSLGDQPVGLNAVYEGAPPPADEHRLRVASGTDLRRKRQLVRRQLRLLFIYPITYIIMWLVPLGWNFTQYSDKLADNPPFVLELMSFMCLASMGVIDTTIFSLREKPWSHIPKSDGTFWGSFLFWRDESKRNSPTPSQVEKAAPPAASSSKGPRDNAVMTLAAALRMGEKTPHGSVSSNPPTHVSAEGQHSNSISGPEYPAESPRHSLHVKRPHMTHRSSRDKVQQSDRAMRIYNDAYTRLAHEQDDRRKRNAHAARIARSVDDSVSPTASAADALRMDPNTGRPRRISIHVPSKGKQKNWWDVHEDDDYVEEAENEDEEEKVNEDDDSAYVHHPSNADEFVEVPDLDLESQLDPENEVEEEDEEARSDPC